MSTVLIIDDDEGIQLFLRVALEQEGLAFESARTATEGIESFTQRRPDLVILDVGLPDLSGLDTFRRLHRLDAKVPVIFLTGGESTGTAIAAMALGAYEYLLKPVELDVLRQQVRRALEVRRLMAVPAAVAEGEATDSQAEADLLVGRCPAMHAVYKAIGRAAPQDVTVLILGESGTGKELVARAIYQHSRRARGPFLEINCAAIPETLLESELFGHEQGAFTGAARQRVGKFEQCNGGTLFLDEVGDMTPLTQTKLLRVLQEQRFERVGGNETVRTDVRVIAATNCDLARMVDAGKFRRDLYYRLNVYAITLPPLRERGNDLALLCRHFLRRFRRELSKDAEGIAPEALALLERYPWPGNVRELQSVLKHALLQASGPILVPEFLPDKLRDPAGLRPIPAASDLEEFIDRRLQEGSRELYTEWLSLTEQRLFSRVLRHTRGNLSQAARLLGIHRATLRSKLNALGIAPETDAGPDEDSRPVA